MTSSYAKCASAATIAAGGSIDSFIDGQSLQNMCTKQGFLGTNSPQSIPFGTHGSGGGVRNCREYTYGLGTWPYATDGCIAYSNSGSATIPPSAVGPGQCPDYSTGMTITDTPLFAAPPVNAAGTFTSSPTCDSTTPLTGGIYHWSSVTLNDGCYIQPGTGRVVIYTDGACSGNPGPGGWGAILREGAHEKELFGGASATTNNRMELTAAAMALESLKVPSQVDLHTDSKYVLGGETGLI